MAKYPERLFITNDEFSDKSGTWLQTHHTPLEAVKDDDRVGDQVATYQLIKVKSTNDYANLQSN